MRDELAKLASDFGKPDTLRPTRGYFSQRNVKACDDHHITPLITRGAMRIISL